MSNTYQEYWTAVHSIARDACEEARFNGNTAYEQIQEAVDGCYWVIHYHAAADVLRFTDNADAIFNDCGSVAYGELSAAMAFAGCDSMGQIHTRAACYAMVQDVLDYVDREGLRGGAE